MPLTNSVIWLTIPRMDNIRQSITITSDSSYLGLGLIGTVVVHVAAHDLHAMRCNHTMPCCDNHSCDDTEIKIVFVAQLELTFGFLMHCTASSCNYGSVMYSTMPFYDCNIIVNTLQEHRIA